MTMALYRKYRPTTFAEVIDQDHIKTTLQNELKTGNIAHAYVFSGPRGVGKTTVARIFAKAINAKTIEQKKLNPKQLVDIIEIDAASHTGVDMVREHIIQNAYVAPVQLQYKVFIIDEVHMLSLSAFNALLKIVEEPPQHVVFILATTEVHKIPATILSRCQRFDFHVMSLPTLVKRLQYICEQEHISVELVILERIARRAAGAMRDAESMLGQILALAENQVVSAELVDLVLPHVDMHVAVDLLEQLVHKHAQQYLQILNQAQSEGVDLIELLKLLIELQRQSLLYSVDQSLQHFVQIDIEPAIHERLIVIMKLLTTSDCLELIRLFTQALADSKIMHLEILPLEAAGLSWCVGFNPVATAIPQPTHQPVVHPVTTQPTNPITSMPAPKKMAPLPGAGPVKSASQNTVAQFKTTHPETLALIKEHWTEVLAELKDLNRALAMTLTVVHVVDVVDENIVRLGMRFGFHRDRIMENNNRNQIRAVLQNRTGQEFVIQCLVDKQYEVELAVIQTLPSDNIDTVALTSSDNVWDLALQTSAPIQPQ